MNTYLKHEHHALLVQEATKEKEQIEYCPTCGALRVGIGDFWVVPFYIKCYPELLEVEDYGKTL